MNTILCNNGYVINKSNICNKLDKIKKDLVVIPFSINKNYYNKNNNIKIYYENSKQICVPRYYGIKTFGCSCDVSDPLSVQTMVDKVVAEFGEINILHNNAAGKSEDLGAFFAPFEEYSLDQWDMDNI